METNQPTVLCHVKFILCPYVQMQGFADLLEGQMLNVKKWHMEDLKLFLSSFIDYLIIAIL